MKVNIKLKKLIATLKALNTIPLIYAIVDISISAY